MAVSHKTRTRLKLATTILTAYGYAVLGAAAVQPLFISDTPLGVRQLGGIALGMAIHGVALYIAPLGDDHAHA